MNPVTWSVYVRQNQLNWGRSTVDIRKPNGEKREFRVNIKNGSGVTEYWTLDELPMWLEADHMTGELAPLSEQTITFTISDAVAIGRYENVIYLFGNNAIPEPLTINLVCEGEAPDWNFDPTEYNSSMSMIAKFKIGDRFSQNPDDVVAAFINNKCVGKASPIYNKRYDAYFLMMNIYSNSNGVVTFKGYDASTGTIYPTVKVADKTIYFSADKLIGSLDEPVILQTDDEIQQEIGVVKGWNWISINVFPSNNSVSEMFKPYTNYVNYIKSKSKSASYDNKWYGELKTINYYEMYKFYSRGDAILAFFGKPAIYEDDAVISIEEGWTWLGCLPTITLSVGDALADMNAVYGDIIKSKNDFAVFDNYEWVGTLTAMNPGQGYAYLSNDPTTKTFKYPTIGQNVKAPSKQLAKNMRPTFTANSFSGNMSIIAIVKNGEEVIEDAVIEAYYDTECRGVSAQSIVDNKHFITVHGDKSGDKIIFYVTTNGNTSKAVSVVEYNSDAIIGNLNEPFEIQLDANLVAEDVTVTPRLVKDVVNVFSTEALKSVMIHNTAGVAVVSRATDKNSLQINIENLPDGVYLVTVETASGKRKVVYIIKG